MSAERHTNSIDDICHNLANIVRNDNELPTDQVGSLIVDCTLGQHDIESLYIDYPILEEISEIGADMERQGEAYFTEYTKELIKKIKALESSINIKKS